MAPASILSFRSGVSLFLQSASSECRCSSIARRVSEAVSGRAGLLVAVGMKTESVRSQDLGALFLPKTISIDSHAAERRSSSFCAALDLSLISSSLDVFSQA